MAMNTDLERALPSTESSGVATPEPKQPPALPSTPPRDAAISLSSLKDNVHLRHVDLLILLCCSVSGLCDSVAFNAAGVFVSMQTGNTIFLALGAANLPAGLPLLWLKALVSIAAFWIGCFVFSQARRINPQSKLTLFLAFLAQSLCIFLSAALAQSQVVADFDLSNLEPSHAHGVEELKPSANPRVLAPIALLAFQFGGQIVASRVLGVSEVPTNVLTSLYCDFLMDPALFAPLGQNPKRNRRFAAACLLVAGGIAGGWLQRSSAGMSSVLWIAGGIKFAMAVAWLVWPSRPVASGKEQTK